MKYARIILMGLVGFGLVGSLQPSEAQIFKRLKDRAKAKVEENLGEKQDEAIDEAFDGEAGAEEGQNEGEASLEADAADSDAADSDVASGAEAAKLKPGEGAWANYDFVPGERPLYVNDFSDDRVGNFPQRMEFKGGNMQVVEWNGQRWLSAEGGELYINLPETLPERFTIEYELAGGGNAMEISLAGEALSYDKMIYVGTNYARIRSGEIDAQGDLKVLTNEEPANIRISVDGAYVKVYANEHRAVNVPNASLLGRSNRIYINMNGWSADEPRMITNLRIMAGGTPMYDALAAEGRFATQGILFDTGSDVIRPESTPTLKEIGDMLTQHADLRLAIEGHTDGVGEEAANQQLSEKRAAAVKTFLVDAYKIDASRLESQGLGETQPAGSNDTPEGRQQNRRVELVKL